MSDAKDQELSPQLTNILLNLQSRVSMLEAMLNSPSCNDRFEQLQQQHAKYRKALEEIVQQHGLGECIVIAIEALED